MTDFTNPFAAPEPPDVPPPGPEYEPPPNPWASNNDSPSSEQSEPSGFIPGYTDFDATGFQPERPVQSLYQPVQPVQSGHEEPTYTNPPVETYDPGYPDQYLVAPLAHKDVPEPFAVVRSTSHSPYGVHRNSEQKNSLGECALGLGITSVVLFLTGLGVFAGIGAIICGTFGIRAANEGKATNKRMSMIGRVLGIVGIVLFASLFIFLGAYS